MNLCLDQGNSSIKIGIFSGDVLVKNYTTSKIEAAEIESLFKEYNIENCILSSVKSDNRTIFDLLLKYSVKFIELTHQTAIPIENKYLTPETLGKDRLAAVVGANFLRPNENCLIIDAGTAITYDFIDSKGTYFGGNIAPGLNMRLKALHEFTDKLPLVEINFDNPFLGNNTHSAISSGVLQGVIFEIRGYIEELRNKYSQLSVFLTGGSIFYFDNKLKSAIFAEKNLVLIGLNRILQYNV